MVEHYTHDNWQLWFEHLSSPLSNVPCGEDLKYEEDFNFLKSSFSGISELDCKRIFITGTHLTAEKSKDLRIASYVLFAAAGEYGIAGLAQGFLLFNDLLERFNENVHPLKEKARKAVNVWLLSQQNRVVALAEQQGQFEPETVALLQEQLTRYNDLILRLIDENAGPLSLLTQWVEKLTQKYPIQVEEVDAQSNTVSDNNGDSTQATQKVANSPEVEQQPETTVQVSAPVQAVKVKQAIDSEGQFTDILRQLLTFDKEQKNYGRMIALSRAARWSMVNLPPNEQGKTRIPAPRGTAFAPIKNALSGENYTEALLLSEALFMEGAMHFNLDLQGLQLNALKGLGESATVKQLELALYQLSSRFPQLANLTYEDGSAFCSAKTKDIISDISSKFNSASQPSSASNKIFDEAEQTAKKWVEQGKLDTALSQLTQVVATTDYDAAKVQLLKAKMCLIAERYDFAAPMLKTLVDAIDKHQLSQWQPNFCMQVWRNAIVCFDSLASNENNNFAQQCNDLKQKMILTQPDVALGWI